MDNGRVNDFSTSYITKNIIDRYHSESNPNDAAEHLKRVTYIAGT